MTETQHQTPGAAAAPGSSSPAIVSPPDTVTGRNIYDLLAILVPRVGLPAIYAAAIIGILYVGYDAVLKSQSQSHDKLMRTYESFATLIEKIGTQTGTMIEAQQKVYSDLEAQRSTLETRMRAAETAHRQAEEAETKAKQNRDEFDRLSRINASLTESLRVTEIRLAATSKELTNREKELAERAKTIEQARSITQNVASRPDTPSQDSFAKLLDDPEAILRNFVSKAAASADDKQAILSALIGRPQSIIEPVIRENKAGFATWISVPNVTYGRRTASEGKSMLSYWGVSRQLPDRQFADVVIIELIDGVVVGTRVHDEAWGVRIPRVNDWYSESAFVAIKGDGYSSYFYIGDEDDPLRTEPTAVRSQKLSSWTLANLANSRFGSRTGPTTLTKIAAGAPYYTLDELEKMRPDAYKFLKTFESDDISQRIEMAAAQKSYNQLPSAFAAICLPNRPTSFQSLCQDFSQLAKLAVAQNAVQAKTLLAAGVAENQLSLLTALLLRNDILEVRAENAENPLQKAFPDITIRGLYGSHQKSIRQFVITMSKDKQDDPWKLRGIITRPYVAPGLASTAN